MDSPSVAPPARRFPLSSALPLAALLILAVGGPASAQLPPVDETVDQVEGTVDQVVDETVDQVQETVDETVDTTTEVTEDVVDTATGAVGGASETVEETGEAVTGAADTAAEDAMGATSIDGSGTGTAPSGAEASGAGSGAGRMTGKGSTGDRDEAGTGSGMMMTPAREVVSVPALLSADTGSTSSGVRPGSGNRGSTPPFFGPIPEGGQIMLLAALAALLSLIGLGKLGARFTPRPATGPRLFLPPLDQ